jgi:transposase-like protein
VSNPGSSIDFERGVDGHVKKAYLQLNSWSRSFKFCLPVLSLDAAHLRCKEGGAIFIASGLSPNRDIVIVAVGIGLIEDRAHWEWFVRKLNSGHAISSFADAVVMSDREKSLDSALKDVLPEVPHSYCSFHLKKNVVTVLKTDLGGNVHKLAKALEVTSDYSFTTIAWHSRLLQPSISKVCTASPNRTHVPFCSL